MFYCDTYVDYEYSVLNDRIEKEMHTQKKAALRKLSSVVAHFNEEISVILAYSWFDSLPDAEKIAQRLDLSKLDLLALQENFEAFKEEFLAHQEASNF